MRKFILLVIAVSVVNTANNGGLLNPFALNQAGKNQGFLFGLNPAGNTPGLLNLFNLPPIDKNLSRKDVNNNLTWFAALDSGIAPGLNSFFWTGLNDLGKTSTFVWDANGLPLSGYTNWWSGQPDFPGSEDCGEYWYKDDAAAQPKWNNRNCTEIPGPFICEVNSACRCYTFI
ncbi:hypothetical protein B566_EDAN015359 [Ephemera danica]|nr:hypothetical protein B566_EDAN015359 [Ephemera danica]